jgi:thiosulfate/3-mercaptopyruvate sulfurtransferase
MKSICVRNVFSSIAPIFLVCISFFCASAQRSEGVSSNTETPAIAGPQLIQPEELVNALKSTNGPKPLIIQVGFHVLYLQAHIPGSEYIGPASSADGLGRLRKRVESLPRTQSILLYCGCCPWSRCPTINPAYKELRAMGFKNVKVLYIAHDFGTDWVEKGYPVAKGE